MGLGTELLCSQVHQFSCECHTLLRRETHRCEVLGNLCVCDFNEPRIALNFHVGRKLSKIEGPLNERITTMSLNSRRSQSRSLRVRSELCCHVSRRPEMFHRLVHWRIPAHDHPQVR